MNAQPPFTGRLFYVLLTPLPAHDRMRLNRARSSMVEQWPFKPLVAGSSPAALMSKIHSNWIFFLSHSIIKSSLATLNGQGCGLSSFCSPPFMESKKPASEEMGW
jgi:hypothetical protein